MIFFNSRSLKLKQKVQKIPYDAQPELVLIWILAFDWHVCVLKVKGDLYQPMEGIFGDSWFSLKFVVTGALMFC
jgi:hypothetical protein